MTDRATEVANIIGYNLDILHSSDSLRPTDLPRNSLYLRPHVRKMGRQGLPFKRPHAWRSFRSLTRSSACQARCSFSSSR